MVDIPLSRSDYFRSVAKEARIRTRNRYFEANPVLTDVMGQAQARMYGYAKGGGSIARMGMRRYMNIGQDGIRGVYSQSGSFNGAMFVASGDILWRVDKNGTQTMIGAIGSASPNAAVKMAATAQIGTTPEMLFVAGGGQLNLYMANSFAKGTLGGTPANGDVVRIDATYYQFTSGSVNAGTPAGTLAAPWLVALGVSTAIAFSNLADAINATGVAGTEYSTALTANPSAENTNKTGTSITVRATAVGALGNAIVTTTTGAALAWTGGTLSGGGATSWTQVDTPGNVGVIDLAFISQYVVVVPAQGQGINGRFFWIEPGETKINALDFATAERDPDAISGVCVFGDQFWLPGANTTETWYFTGNLSAPVLRVQGIVFDRGAWEGTALQVKDCMIIVDNLGGVFQIQGGAQRISRPDVEEVIRKAIQFQAAQLVI